MLPVAVSKKATPRASSEILQSVQLVLSQKWMYFSSLKEESAQADGEKCIVVQRLMWLSS